MQAWSSNVKTASRVNIASDRFFRARPASQTLRKQQAFRNHRKRRRWASSGSRGVTASGKAGLALPTASGFEPTPSVSYSLLSTCLSQNSVTSRFASTKLVWLWKNLRCQQLSSSRCDRVPDGSTDVDSMQTCWNWYPSRSGRLFHLASYKIHWTVSPAIASAAACTEIPVLCVVFFQRNDPFQ